MCSTSYCINGPKRDAHAPQGPYIVSHLELAPFLHGLRKRRGGGGGGGGGILRTIVCLQQIRPVERGIAYYLEVASESSSQHEQQAKLRLLLHDALTGLPFSELAVRLRTLSRPPAPFPLSIFLAGRAALETATTA